MEYATICLYLHYVLIVVCFNLRKHPTLHCTHFISESLVILNCPILEISPLRGAKPQCCGLFKRIRTFQISGNPKVRTVALMMFLKRSACL